MRPVMRLLGAAEEGAEAEEAAELAEAGEVEEASELEGVAIEAGMEADFADIEVDVATGGVPQPLGSVSG